VIGRVWEGLASRLRLLTLSAKSVAGRRYWLWPPVPLIWPAFQAFRVLMGWREEGPFQPPDAQNVLIAFPLAVLAVIFGVRVIAGEIDRRTLEIAYTVPGGVHRVWLYKLAGATALLFSAELLLAAAAWLITDYPLGALYGALQSAVFYLAVSMAFSALFKSEAAGALATVAVLVLNWPFQMGRTRVSAFWNPEALTAADPREVLAWTVQNRIGFAIATVAIAALAFGRAQNREKLLGG
jgi:hypothetical protein